MEGFIDFCKNTNDNPTLYFHNLKFDGEFIIYYLLTNGFTYIKDKKERENNTFTTLISDMGQFYSIEIYFTVSKKRVNKVTIFDSFKIIPFSVDNVAKAFKLDIQKLEIDYHKKRKIGHILSEDEIAYLKNDVTIMAEALDVFFKEDLNKMTQARKRFKRL